MQAQIPLQTSAVKIDHQVVSSMGELRAKKWMTEMKSEGKLEKCIFSGSRIFCDMLRAMANDAVDYWTRNSIRFGTKPRLQKVKDFVNNKQKKKKMHFTDSLL